MAIFLNNKGGTEISISYCPKSHQFEFEAHYPYFDENGYPHDCYTSSWVCAEELKNTIRMLETEGEQHD